MKIVCAWCEKEGIPSLLAVWPPDGDLRISHGICDTHATLYRKTLFSRGTARLSSGLHDRIAARAFALYKTHGNRQGCELQDWLDAEREILSHQQPA